MSEVGRSAAYSLGATSAVIAGGLKADKRVDEKLIGLDEEDPRVPIPSPEHFIFSCSSSLRRRFVLSLQ